MQSSRVGAIACFVKTPGLSPIKQKLAVELGQEKAEEFYLRSLECLQAVLQRTMEISQCKLNLFWAVQEEEGLKSPLWSNHGKMWQGPGTLGQKLCRIYETLLKEHSFVMLVGLDSPQLTPFHIIEAYKRLTVSPFVIGKAKVGGFYLFAGNKEIPEEVWNKIPFSGKDTAEQLNRALSVLGSVSGLSVLQDVDLSHDLFEVGKILSEDTSLLEIQRRLGFWILSQSPGFTLPL